MGLSKLVEDINELITERIGEQVRLNNRRDSASIDMYLEKTSNYTEKETNK